MYSERLRALRHSFVALIDLSDIQSEKHLAALTKDLNLLGCFVETATPFPEGTKVRLRIWHAGVNFYAGGKVAYSQPNSGMGIAFTTVEVSRSQILGTWLASLRN
jgi:ABC-type Na+ transport system ATPase subunit NatA